MLVTIGVYRVNKVKNSFCGTIIYYIGNNLLIECTISRYEGRKSRRKSSDSLKNPFTRQKFPDLKVYGFEVSALFIVL